MVLPASMYISSLPMMVVRGSETKGEMHSLAPVINALGKVL